MLFLFEKYADIALAKISQGMSYNELGRLLGVSNNTARKAYLCGIGILSVGWDEGEEYQYELDCKGRPKTRGECINGLRPCPWVSCRYHLLLNISYTGTITGIRRVNLGNEDGIYNALIAMKETCALDIADQGGVTLEEIGDLLDLTRERVRQIEAVAIRRFKVLGVRLVD